MLGLVNLNSETCSCFSKNPSSENMASRSAFLLLCVLALAAEETLASVFSSRLIHRFSDEARASIKTPSSSDSLPEKRSLEYYQLLARSDFRRQRMNLGSKFQSLVPSEGSKTISSGNDFGWYIFFIHSSSFYLQVSKFCTFRKAEYFLFRGIVY